MRAGWFAVLVLVPGAVACHKKPTEEPAPTEPAHTSGHSVSHGGSGGSGKSGKHADSGPPLEQVSAVSAGAERACAIADDKLYCWNDGEGASPIDTPAAVLSVGNASCAILMEGKLYCWPQTLDLAARQVGGSATDICASSGPHVSCWKPGDTSPRTHFDWLGVDKLMVDDGRVCSVAAGASIECISTSAKPEEHPAQITEVQDVDQVAVGNGLTCASHTKGNIECWHEPNSRFSVTGVVAAGIAMGPRGDACALGPKGEITCWKVKPDGSGLVDGTHPVTGVLGASSLVMGATFGCAVSAKHTAICWSNDAWTPRTIGRAKS